MAKFHVCPECLGECYVSRIKGGFTAGEIDEYYGEEADEFITEYTTRGGAYDEPCPACRGNGLVTTAERSAYRDRLEYEAERNAEIRAGC